MLDFLSSSRLQKGVFAGIAFLLAGIALFNAFKQSSAFQDVGFLLVWAAILVFIQGFRRSSVSERNSAHWSALITLLFGLLLINAELFKSKAVYVFVVLLFTIDALRQLFAFIRLMKKGLPYLPQLFFFIGNLAVLLAVFFLRGKDLGWLIAVIGSLRIAGMGIEILTARLGVMKEVGEDVVKALGLQGYPEIEKIAKDIEENEATRASIDRRWITVFLLVLFFIHLGRLGFDRSSTGVLSPFVALVGDIVIALIIGYAVVIPLFSFFRKLLNPWEKKLWIWVISKPAAEQKKISFRKLLQYRLEYRLRAHIRIRKAGYSFKTAFRSGLQVGLPYAALLAAIIPVFGMSWYFDTENWASGIWDSWAAKRTDAWRTAMIKSVDDQPSATSFMINPPGVNDTSAFSFLIIGDPGEGDASQFILSDQIRSNSNDDQVKFLVISSDVVYPDGAMKDYERNFWLPMKGVNKPVYAIPGNHDWYDALEGFAATFFDSTSATKAMRARRAADLDLSSLAHQKIQSQIVEASRLRNEYRVPTGYQQAPFFQLQTKDFAFICVETGVLRRIDEVQMEWLKQVLEASKDKFIFILAGHPFYAAGEYQGNMNPDFAALHQLCRNYRVAIVMAGDTHDLEYYEESFDDTGSSREMHHFVNGGGGAYLSLGAALNPSHKMPEKVWAHYPAATPIIDKIEKNTGWLKRPAWIWTKKYNGWPFSAEWLSAAFDYNKAPFFQSYMEIQVDPILNKVKLKARGINGPLTWSEMEYSEGVKPAGVADDAVVEWVFPLKTN